MAAGELDPEKVTEATVAKYLDEPDMPDVDLFLRPSGELRTSNFLIWQSAYAEFVFQDKLFPDFDRRDLWAACVEYASRDRRFGGVKCSGSETEADVDRNAANSTAARLVPRCRCRTSKSASTTTVAGFRIRRRAVLDARGDPGPRPRRAVADQRAGLGSSAQAAALHKRVAERNAEMQFGSITRDPPVASWADVILRYTFPADGLDDGALTTMLLLALSGASRPVRGCSRPAARDTCHGRRVTVGSGFAAPFARILNHAFTTNDPRGHRAA